MIDLVSIVEKTIEVARTAGQFIRKESENFKQSAVEHKGFNDLVSYVDKQAEQMIAENLSQLLPEAGFIAEEGTSNKKGADYNWIIDPLDGTTNFVHGLPVFAVSIALAYADEVVVGVVYEINRDECFFAVKNGGAYCNGQKISVTSNQQLADSLIATGFPYYDFEQMPKYLAILQDLMQNSHGLRRMGSAAVDLVYVACGRFDAFFEYNLNAWDVAAGLLIVEESGGQVTDFSGGNNALFGREILATNRLIHREAIAKIQSHWT